MKKLLLLTLITLLGHIRLATDPKNEEFDINDYAWLAGSWIGDGFGGTSEEIWSLPSADGKMMGVFRHHKGDGTLNFYEFLVLDETGIKIKHFNPDLMGWETKDDFVHFKMVEYTVDKVDTETLIYKRISNSELTITGNFENEDSDGNVKVVQEIFNMKKQSGSIKESDPAYAWLANSWIGDGFGGTSEEMWSLPSSDGTMIGAYRHHKGDGSLNFYEFMVMDETGLRLKHFTPEMIGWETKEDFVHFKMIEVSEGKIELKGLVFEKKPEDRMEIRLRLRYSDDRVETEVFNMKAR